MIVVEGTADVDDVDAFVAGLDEVGETFDCAVTALDARYVAGRRHLEVAVERAGRAFERDDAIADDRGIEILLYAAGRRQIRQALEMGVSEGRSPVVVVIDGGGREETSGAEVAGDGTASDTDSRGDEVAAAERVRAMVEPADVLGQAREEDRIREFFGISAVERSATDASLELLVIERVSLLAVEK